MISSDLGRSRAISSDLALWWSMLAPPATARGGSAAQSGLIKKKSPSGREKMSLGYDEAEGGLSQSESSGSRRPAESPSSSRRAPIMHKQSWSRCGCGGVVLAAGVSAAAAAPWRFIELGWPTGSPEAPK